MTMILLHTGEIHKKDRVKGKYKGYLFSLILMYVPYNIVLISMRSSQVFGILFPKMFH